MSKFTLEIELNNDKSCVDCRFLTYGLNAECELLGDKSPSICAGMDGEINYERPTICPFHPVKLQPRCGDCKHADNSWADDGEIFCPLADRCKSENFYCADFEEKGENGRRKSL